MGYCRKMTPKKLKFGKVRPTKIVGYRPHDSTSDAVVLQIILNQLLIIRLRSG